MCITFFALLCLYIYEIQYSFVVRPDTTRRWGWCFGETMGKLKSIRRELECRRGRCKNLRIKNADRAFNLNSAHGRKERET
jgi:hypothetical protein